VNERSVILLTVVLLGLLAALYSALRRQRAAALAAEQRHAVELREQLERFEEAKRSDQSRMAAVLDAMIEGLVVIDTDQKLVLANRAAEAMFGFSRMMAGGTLLEAVRNHEIATIARRAVVEDAPIEHELRADLPRLLIVQMSAVALRNRAGERTGAVLVFHDVTRLRQLESVRQDFVANVSHELRTPLSLIRSATETLVDGGATDPAVTTRFLQIIDKHAQRLTLLIDDLLLLARIDAGRMPLDLGRVALRSLVQESLDDAAPLAKARGVTLRNEVAPPTEAQADAVRLRQVLGNLIDNAIKYGRPEGTVVVSARPISSVMLEIAVADDGPGIPVEAQARIFERFFRVDRARSREQGGTGLGLAIVKNVVQAHGGDVGVVSNPGQGATFTFTLPLA
jgi:two-component system phosphate regulon sensor histidine kinase PhoR